MATRVFHFCGHFFRRVVTILRLSYIFENFLKKCFAISCVCGNLLGKELRMELRYKRTENPHSLGGFFPLFTGSVAIHYC